MLGLVTAVVAAMALGGPASQEAPALVGTVHDAAGLAVAAARIELRGDANGRAAAATTLADGSFRLTAPPGRYVLRIAHDFYAPFEQVVHLGQERDTELKVRLVPHTSFSDAIVVTPAPGSGRRALDLPVFTTVLGRDELSRRPAGIFNVALREEPGLHLQQTSTSQGSLFIRGLTGQQAVTLIDGVRFNNSTFRPGANQYTALIDPALAGQVEIVHGPHSVLYGSDALGGTINVIPAGARPAAGAISARGSASISGGSADGSRGLGARAELASATWSFTGGASGRWTEDLRAGRGLDSHSVATRLLGLSSQVLGGRLAQTGYRQHGFDAALSHRPGAGQSLTLEYVRNVQDGASRYDQLDGGQGNLLHRFDPQALDFGLARYRRTGAGRIESFAATFSFNRQRDDRTFQNINNSRGLLSPITEEENRTTVFGHQASVTARLGDRQALTAGVEAYLEDVDSLRRELSFSTATRSFSTSRAVRARFPNEARYRTLAAYAHDEVRLASGLTAAGGLRFTHVRYEQAAAHNPPATVTDFRTSVSDATFDAGLVWAPAERVRLSARMARGFRAPNVNDLASIGTSGLGFEVSPDEALRLGGATERDGIQYPVRALEPELARSYELGLKLEGSRLEASLAGFQCTIRDSIERRTLLLAPGAVGGTIGGQPVVQQAASGAVVTPVSSTPVFVRVNTGEVRFRGATAAATLRLPGDLRLSLAASMVHAVDPTTGAPPNVENGVPPAGGTAGLRWLPSGRRFWGEAYSVFAATQRRLSENDLAQARIGGRRTRSEITNFFNNGAVARGLVQDGLLVATGETLDQVLARVLGSNLSGNPPLFTTNPGFGTLNLRGGWRAARRVTLTVMLENLFDTNYRTMGSGVDGPGFNASAHLTLELGGRRP